MSCYLLLLFFLIVGGDQDHGYYRRPGNTRLLRRHKIGCCVAMLIQRVERAGPTQIMEIRGRSLSHPKAGSARLGSARGTVDSIIG